MLRRLGAVQLDTISVLARSHELVAYARLGPVGRAAVESAYWGGNAFEYWAHAACVLPIDEWPWFAVRRRRLRERQRVHGRTVSAAAQRDVLKRLADGPCTATELGGAKKGGPWWDWSDVKLAVERMLAIGDVVCVERRGWKRVYDLPERVIPPALRALDPTDEECYRELARRAARQYGVATRTEIANHYGLLVARIAEVIDDIGLVPVTVAGWPEAASQPAFADPDWLERLLSRQLRGRHRTTLVSPFDSLIWDRGRTARIFGFTHKIEAYTPAPDRVHGYYPMPLLAGGRLVGRVDPGRKGRTLVAKQVSLSSARFVDAAAAALVEAAAWVGCDNVAVDIVNPPELRAEKSWGGSA